jgi:hypothetical protein
MMLEISELLLPAIVIQILLSIKELVCHTFDNKKKCIPKLALEIQDLLLLATVLLPRLDDISGRLLGRKEVDRSALIEKLGEAYPPTMLRMAARFF